MKIGGFSLRCGFDFRMWEDLIIVEDFIKELLSIV